MRWVRFMLPPGSVLHCAGTREAADRRGRVQSDATAPEFL